MIFETAVAGQGHRGSSCLYFSVPHLTHTPRELRALRPPPGQCFYSLFFPSDIH
jgi:hypothetical protein